MSETMKDKPTWLKALETQPCECELCDVCDGKGSVYLDMYGKYVGKQRTDDMQDPAQCEMCHGGIVEFCDRCSALADYEDED